MPVSLALLLTAGVLIACGVYLFLERTLSRVLLGFILAGNGVNLLFLVAAGKPGRAPFEGDGSPESMSDPLPFAMVLTAIVITLGVSAFVIALAYRAWQLFGHDEVPDDVEDRRVLRRSRRRRIPRTQLVAAGAAHAGAEGPHEPEEPAAPLPPAPGVSDLSEEHRHGALAVSQGSDAVSPRDETVAEPGADDDGTATGREAAEDERESGDDLGADLTSAQDAPLDHTESDEDEDSEDLAGPAGRQRRRPGRGERR